MTKLGIFVLLGALLLFTRLYNLENTTRFIWDESNDLVRIHQIYSDKKLTLIGPISEDNSKVFGSLAYYLSMPFAVIGRFDPLSPIYGTVIGSLVTAGGLLMLTRRLNPKLSVLLVGVIVLAWFPLFQSARSGLWAWHVSYIPMWLTLGILFYLRRSKFSTVLTGFFLGLSLHHHFIAVFAIVSFALATVTNNVYQRRFLRIWLLGLGVGIAILPFVVFDLRHPPGLFLTKVLYSSPVESQMSFLEGWQKLTGLATEMAIFFTQSQVAAAILGFTTLVLLTWDIKNRHQALLWSAGWVGQLVGLVFINNDGVSVHYHLPASIFFLVWLITPRNGKGKYLSTFALLILLVSAVIGLKPQLTRTNWQTDIPSVRLLTNTIKTWVITQNLTNNNLAILASPDNNIYGRRYRDVLLVENVRLKTKDEYQYSDHLFVISTASESVLRSDRAYEMHFFRNGELLNKWSWPNSEWNLYLFNRNPH